MIDFPNSPTVGQVVSSPNGTAWRWTGSTWVLGTAASAGGARGTVAYAQVTTGQTGIGSATVDIAGLSATWTASPNRRYKTTAYIAPSSSVAGDEFLAFIQDAGAGIIQTASAPHTETSVSTNLEFSVIETGLSGSITRKVTIRRAGGTGSLALFAAPTAPAFILVEDITYDAGPGGAAGALIGGTWRRASSGLVVPNNVFTMVPWDVEDSDSSNMVTLGNPTVTIPKAGIWAITATVTVASGAAAPRHLLEINIPTMGWPGTDVRYRNTTANEDAMSVNATIRFNAGQTFQIGAFQNSGTAHTDTFTLAAHLVADL